MKKTIALVVLLAVMAVGGIRGQVAITHATVEYQDGLQPLATNVPRFSWQYETNNSNEGQAIAINVKQTSYRIIVASTRENAKKNIGDLWDTKTLSSNRMLLIPYEGKPLHSRDKAYWKVIASVTYNWKNDETNGLGATTLVEFIESDINSFEISLMDSADWHAKWIGGDFYNDDIHGKTRIASRYLRKEFSISKNIRDARLYVCGLGQYSAYINGAEVAPEEILKPALSDYNKRVYFNAYDVTDMLKKGNNAVGVTLAGGRYTTVRYNEKNEEDFEWGGLTHAMHYGTPQLLLQLEVTYTDGNKELIVSDKSWKITDCGPIQKSNEFDGETYDERYTLDTTTNPGTLPKWWKPREAKSCRSPTPISRCRTRCAPFPCSRKTGNGISTWVRTWWDICSCRCADNSPATR